MGKKVEIMLQHQTLSLLNRFLELNGIECLADTKFSIIRIVTMASHNTNTLNVHCS